MKHNEGESLSKNKKKYASPESFKSPDTHKLQEVIIDNRTRIYIAEGASADEARDRYLNRQIDNKRKAAVRQP